MISLPAPTSRLDRPLLALFTVAIFTAAALLFVVQPMVGKMVLPRGGGSPQVWNTSLVFFQVALLAGYLYAHYSVRWLGVRVQAAAHAVVLMLPFLVLPIALPDIPAPAGDPQAPWILVLLVVAVGAPFFVLAAASPLLQRWLATTRHQAATDPYFLYAGSNAGSLAGLLAYPFVVEPLLPLTTQSRLWTVGYGGFVALALGCIAVAVRSSGRGAAEASATAALEASAAAPLDRPSTRNRLFWLAAAAIPSSLLMGATQYLTSQIAPVPLLWVIPLAVYLMTFIVAFARRQVVTIPVVSRLLATAAVVVALAMLVRASDPPWLVMAVHLSMLAIASLLCHVRLAGSRPPARHLTEFYLLIAAGGALGGVFGALVAPYAFDFIAEYPIAIVLACLFRIPMRPGTGRLGGRAARHFFEGRALDVAAPVLLALYVVAGELFVRSIEGVPDGVYVIFVVALPTLVCFVFSPRPVRFFLGVAVLLTFAQAGGAYGGANLHMERTFFGVYRVSRDSEGTVNILFHGPTAHGVQRLDPARAGEPLAYYHPTGPAGRVVTSFADQDDRREIALVGAGTGALTALAGPHQRVTLYEIDPAILRIAEDPRYFTFLRDARASYRTVVGDGRLALSSSEDRFDLIVLDAFTSGSIPIHLLTREAIELYLNRLHPGGVLLAHISNRHLDLAPVLARHASDLGLVAFESIDVREGDDEHVFSSHWVVMGRRPADLALISGAGWTQLTTTRGAPRWTDDFSNLLTVLRWN